MEIAGKVALVTGAGSGIGRATALALARAGASVVIADVDERGGCQTLCAVDSAGGTASFIKIDVTRRSDIERMVSYAEEAFGALHILHNNAGVNAGWPRFPGGSQAEWERTLMVNVWAVLAGTEAAVPLMRKSRGGVIVNMASLAGLVAYETDPIYAATKHAVVGLTRALAFLKDEANVRVNCLCPSFVDTPLPRRRLEVMAPAEREAWESTLARMPMLEPSAVASAILDVILDDTLNGQAIAMTRGQSPRVVQAPLAV